MAAIRELNSLIEMKNEQFNKTKFAIMYNQKFNRKSNDRSLKTIYKFLTLTLGSALLKTDL